jgi:pimeloyl-ACP methyl ester carboxylesterase
LWERLVLPENWVLNCPSIQGLGTHGTAVDWSLSNCAQTLSVLAAQADVLVGHDLGGVLAAMLAKPDQNIVLSGTALRYYWWAIRGTALPGVQRVFYQRYAGRRFLSRGGLPENSADLLTAFGDNGPDWSDRMRQIAAGMKPPRGLANKLSACKVHLIWGEQDPWYPMFIAKAIQRATQASLHTLPCGHFTPWEDPVGFSQALQQCLGSSAFSASGK